jgi:hypothetical protein
MHSLALKNPQIVNPGRFALLGFAVLASVIALAFSAVPADASIYWQQEFPNRDGEVESDLGRANSDGTNALHDYLTGEVDGVDSDGTYIYWSDNEAKTIGRVGVDGKGASRRFITGAGPANNVTVGANAIYWINGASIASAALDGSNVNLNLVPGANAAGIAVDANYVYWTSNTQNSIGRAALDGSGVNAAFVPGIPASAATNMGGITVNASSIYFAVDYLQGTNGDSEGIWRSNIDGTGAALLTNAPNSASDVALDSTYLYWSDTGNAGSYAPSGMPTYNTGAIGRVPLDGSAAPDASLITGLGFPAWLAVDATASGKVNIDSRLVRIRGTRGRAVAFCSRTGNCWGTLSIVTAPKYRVGKNRRARLTLGTGSVKLAAGKRSGVSIGFNSRQLRRAFGRRDRIVAYAQITSGQYKRIVLER